ncbi:MAG: hypothetical protein JXA30_11430 [Deltaproteobacteria bacterium]|nr:hypothetical protein [Deltaproteobacteria bacterium]
MVMITTVDPSGRCRDTNVLDGDCFANQGFGRIQTCIEVGIDADCSFGKVKMPLEHVAL